MMSNNTGSWLSRRLFLAYAATSPLLTACLPRNGRTTTGTARIVVAGDSSSERRARTRLHVVRRVFLTNRAVAIEPARFSTHMEYREFRYKRIAACAAIGAAFQESRITGEPVDFAKLRQQHEQIIESGPLVLDSKSMARGLDYLKMIRMSGIETEAAAGEWRTLSEGLSAGGAVVGALEPYSGPLRPWARGASLILEGGSAAAWSYAKLIESRRFTDPALIAFDRDCVDSVIKHMQEWQDVLAHSHHYQTDPMKYWNLYAPLQGAELEVTIPGLFDAQTRKQLKVVVNAKDEEQAIVALQKLEEKFAENREDLERTIEHQIEKSFEELPGKLADELANKMASRAEKRAEAADAARKRAYRNNEVAGAFHILQILSPPEVRPFLEASHSAFQFAMTLGDFLAETAVKGTMGPFGLISMGVQLIANFAGLFGGKSNPSFETQVIKALEGISASLERMHKDLLAGLESLHKELAKLGERIEEIKHISKQTAIDVEDIRREMNRRESLNGDREQLITEVELHLRHVEERLLTDRPVDADSIRRVLERVMIQSGHEIFIGNYSAEWDFHSSVVSGRQDAMRDSAIRWLAAQRDPRVAPSPRLEAVRRASAHTNISALDAIIRAARSTSLPIAPQEGSSESDETCEAGTTGACSPGVMVNPLSLAFSIHAIADLWMELPDQVDARIVHERGCEYLGRIESARETLCYVSSPQFHAALVEIFDQTIVTLVEDFKRAYDEFESNFKDKNGITDKKYPNLSSEPRSWTLYTHEPPRDAIPIHTVTAAPGPMVTSNALRQDITLIPPSSIVNFKPKGDKLCRVLRRGSAYYPAPYPDLLIAAEVLGLIRFSNKRTHQIRYPYCLFGMGVREDTDEMDVDFLNGEYKGQRIGPWRDSKVILTHAVNAPTNPSVWGRGAPSNAAPPVKSSGRIYYLADTPRQLGERKVQDTTSFLRIIGEQLQTHYRALHHEGSQRLKNALQPGDDSSSALGRQVFSRSHRDAFHRIVFSLAYIRAISGWYLGYLDPVAAVVSATEFPSFERFMGTVFERTFHDDNTGRPVREAYVEALSLTASELILEFPAPEPTDDMLGDRNELEHAASAVRAAMARVALNPNR